MKYRHEVKHEINLADRMVLLPRLSAVMKRDSHAINGVYHIRSLYFDSMDDRALQEKINGKAKREKFRIRYYNNDLSYIVLEKKCKIDNLCAKESCRLSKEEAQKIVDGDIAWMLSSERTLCIELYTKMKSKGLRPRTIVDYTREPFVFAPGNVRVTIDYNVRTGLMNTDFLNPETLTLQAGERNFILEVKWDEFLPSVIRDAVNIPGRREGAFSKYERARIYG